MNLMQVKIVATLLIVVLFVLTFLAFYVISGNKMRSFRSAGIMFSIIGLIAMLIILTGDVIAGMFGSVIALIAFLIIYYWYYYTPKGYIRNIKKQIKISEEFEGLYQKICKRYSSMIWKRRILIYICIVGIIFWWIHFVYSRKNGTFNHDMSELYFYFQEFLWLVILLCHLQIRDIYKQYVLPDLILLFPGNAMYYREISPMKLAQIKDEYYASGFDSDKIIDMNVRDCIISASEDTSLNIATVEITNKTRGRDHFSFVGLFAYAKSSKPINYYMKISKNKIKKQNYRVNMDSSNFEEIFDVYGGSDINTMRILTPDVMMMLVDFYEKYKLKFEIILTGHRIYFKFYTGDIFKAKILGNSMTRRNLFMNYSIIEFITELTKNINKAIENIEI